MAHWEDCYKEHHACALKQLERMRDALMEIRSAIVEVGASLPGTPRPLPIHKILARTAAIQISSEILHRAMAALPPEAPPLPGAEEL